MSEDFDRLAKHILDLKERVSALEAKRRRRPEHPYVGKTIASVDVHHRAGKMVLWFTDGEWWEVPL